MRGKKLQIPAWPVGTSVIMVNCAEADLEKYKGKAFKTTSEAYEMCGSSVVFLEGVRGCFGTKFLKVVA